MSLSYARSLSNNRRSTKQEDDDSDDDGYVQVYVKPMEQGGCAHFLSWIGLSSEEFNLNNQRYAATYGFAGIIGCAIVYKIFSCDLGLFVYRICGFIMPAFTIVCIFYWLSFYLRKTWSTLSIYLLFVSCYLSETLALMLIRSSSLVEETANKDAHDNLLNETQTVSSQSETMFVLQPLVILCIMLSISVASVFSSLETIHSAVVIITVSFTRFLACTSLTALPAILRPYSAYTWAFCGVMLSKYMETLFAVPLNNHASQDGKIPVIKRRRSSSSSSHPFAAHRNNRRTSLPALAMGMRQSSSASYDSAIIAEAHGLVSDMLAESNLPPHVISGLRAVSNLLKPTENQNLGYKARVSPLVSLTESTNYGSDTEDSPYTGERPTTLPKRLRRSLPPSLIRRMSTSTWTTTTSATGMPTVEKEPCRLRSSSFRQQRIPDNITPGSSPTASRSNSPSPSSPSTVTLSIPKARSFSVGPSNLIQPGSQKRQIRKSVCFVGQTDIPPSEPVSKQPSRLDSNKDDLTLRESHNLVLNKRFNITSDYESSDSPSSSDHSDNVATSDDISSSMSPPKKVMCRVAEVSPIIDHRKDTPISQPPEVQHTIITSKPTISTAIETSIPTCIPTCIPTSIPTSIATTDTVDSKLLAPPPDEPPLFDPSDVDNCQLLDTKLLADWDYPIFNFSDITGSFILSKLAYKVFSEVGLFETFRIPLGPFLRYFHALEMGYRDIPYHNRIHAADVLHGVYFFTSQPIPGLQPVNHSDLVSRHQSSMETECDERQIVFKTTCTDDSYGIMGGNLPALELMALYTAAAMHDYDHPGRTNAFLVTTYSPQAILYNDRSVLENHHAASAWRLFMGDQKYNFLSGLDAAEFKRFRFISIEAILATDLKRHFEILAEFNAKVNVDDAPGIDWTVETDRLLVSQMVIKLCDINGPAKRYDLHVNWTTRITEEFYEQGNEESSLGLPISPFMDRHNPQLAKLQESFINHLVAPLCNAMVTGGIVPGTWVDEEHGDSDGRLSDSERGDSRRDTEDDTDDQDMCIQENQRNCKQTRRIHCVLTKNMKENHEMWVKRMKDEEKQKALLESVKLDTDGKHPDGHSFTTDKSEMEPIKEENENSPKRSPTKTS